jgi:hypothetical protein
VGGAASTVRGKSPSFGEKGPDLVKTFGKVLAVTGEAHTPLNKALPQPGVREEGLYREKYSQPSQHLERCWRVGGGKG